MLRVVFTGAPSSGKSTTAEIIAKRMPEWRVNEEVATKLIRLGLRGSDEADFSLRILAEMLSLEGVSQKWPVTIYDRGIPDSAAYLSLCGKAWPPNASAISLRDRYDLVFCFNPLPFERGSNRNEFDEKNAALLAELLPNTYRQLNYPVIPVPVCAVAERAEIVIGHIVNNLTLLRNSHAINTAPS